MTVIWEQDRVLLAADFFLNIAVPMAVDCHTLIKDDLGPREEPRALPANTRRCTNVVLLLAHRLRCWTSIKTTLAQRLVFAGLCCIVPENTRR